MRLLHHDHDGELVLTAFDDYEQPAYTILSHTWGDDEEEVSFADLMNGNGKDKLGYNKIHLCGEQTRRDGLRYFWVDTCCIDKSNKAEISSAIRSMFRWYQDAAKCYVYLSDVSTKEKKLDGMLGETDWERSLRSSRWFTRGWTLQELLAPSVVELFSQEWERIGDKTSLGPLISRTTGIPQDVLQEGTLSQFDISERLRWRGDRKTKLKEDMAYSLSGICDVDIAPLYGEGEEEAFRRLNKEIQKLRDCLRDLRHGDPRDDKKRIEETKGGLLVDSYRWVLNNDTYQQWQRDPQAQLLWVKGDPGKGKTMLLCGIIDELRSSMPKAALLSYFFCQATFSHLNSATAVLRGLLYMLIKQQPSLASHIYKSYDLAGKRLFEDANAWVVLTEIWEDVLRDPGLRMGYLLIDALDECTTDRSKLLRFIAMQTSSSSRLKWIVSSRNWPEIERSLDPAAGKVPLSLELNAHSISAAVKTFINTKVSRLADEERYDEQIRNVISEYLSANANDTFLWVALVCQCLKGTAKRHVMKKLKSIPPGLEPFYKRMLNGIGGSDDAEICLCVLATTAILFRPIVIQELITVIEPLEEFADELETVREIVKLCGSFLTIKDDTVYFVHQSAQDFLLVDAKDKIFPYGIGISHQGIFRRSLAVLSSQLHRDMYKLKAPGISIYTAQPPSPDPLASLRYSCIYWIDHLCNSQSTIQLSHAGSTVFTDEIMLFMKERYLYWLEGLSLCESTTKGVLAMKALFSLAETLDAQDLVDLVKDAHRFFVHSKDVIETYPLQTYHSALLFSPRGSLIRTAFQHEEPNWITIGPDMSETWGSCLHTFEDSCSAVAFSQDLNQLVLGLEDGMIKTWDADSNTYLLELKSYESDSHIERVRYFDESSKLVAVLGVHEMIEVWEVATGTCLFTQEYDQGPLHRIVPFCNDTELRVFAKATVGDSARIFDTAEARELSILMSPHRDGRFKLNSTFSPSGRFLFVNFETNLKIWDATSKRHIQSFELPPRNEDSDSTFVASAWVSDSALLAVGLSDGTVIVFSIDSGDVLHILQSGDPPGWGREQTVAISYDSKRVATPSGLSNLRIWDLSDTSNPHTLVDNSDDEIIFVAFLSDSRRLVSMSLKGRTKIWDICGEDVSQRLDDHQSWINSLTWSNDSNYLASGASDSTVKIWDLHGRCLQTLHGHSGIVVRVDWFHHPARVGSLSMDDTYRIWDVVSGQCLHVYEWGLPGTVIAMSPDLRILARTKATSTTGKRPIQLWDVMHDVSLPDLCDDSAAHIRSLAFSGDSTQLAVLVDDKIVRIFDTRSGECVQTLIETDEELRYSLPFGHYSVTFSKDAIRLVSAWGNGTIRVWDINSGRCLHTVETAILSTDVSVDQSGRFLLTEYGRIAIPESSDLEGNLAGSINHSPAFHGVRLSTPEGWIVYNSVNVLWLPPEYRAGFSVVSGNSVGMAIVKRVWIFTISPEYLE